MILNFLIHISMKFLLEANRIAPDGYSVCLCPIKRTPDLNELKKLQMSLCFFFQTHKDSAEVQLAGATLIMALSANGTCTYSSNMSFSLNAETCSVNNLNASFYEFFIQKYNHPIHNVDSYRLNLCVDW